MQQEHEYDTREILEDKFSSVKERTSNSRKQLNEYSCAMKSHFRKFLEIRVPVLGNRLFLCLMTPFLSDLKMNDFTGITRKNYILYVVTWI